MSQQLQPQQQLQQWLPTVITALATARAGHSMVALVRNPRRADRVTPRRAKPRRAKPRPIARRWHHERRWHQRLAPDSLSLFSLSLSASQACEPRAAAQAADRCHPAAQADAAFTLERVGRDIAPVCDEDGVIFFQARPPATLVRSGSHGSQHSPSTAVGSTPSRSPARPRA